MYDDYAFGSASLRFATPEVEPWRAGDVGDGRGPAVARDRPRASDRARGRRSPTTPSWTSTRLTNWGERRPTRWIVAAMITHDAYHAGEINHLRSLLGPDDRWRFQQLGFG